MPTFKVTVEFDITLTENEQKGEFNVNYIAQKYADMALSHGSIGATKSTVVNIERQTEPNAKFKFEIGKAYETQSGKWVTALDRTTLLGYECLICSDDKCRYDRSTHSDDAGRVTGTDFDYSHPENFKR